MTEGLLAILAIVALCVLWARLASSALAFEGDYRFEGEFPGKLHECVFNPSYGEAGYLCWIGANGSHLFLLNHADGKGSRFGLPFEQRGFDKNLSIPWRAISLRPRRFFLKDCVWFELPAIRVGFYLPRDVAEKVLADAGRQSPRR